MNIRLETNTLSPEDSTLVLEGSPQEINAAYASISESPKLVSADEKEALIRTFIGCFPERHRTSRIATIKAVRSVLRIGLREAKDLVEGVWG